jgi:hypothetical protein
LVHISPEWPYAGLTRTPRRPLEWRYTVGERPLEVTRYRRSGDSGPAASGAADRAVHATPVATPCHRIAPAPCCAPPCPAVSPDGQRPDRGTVTALSREVG